MDVRVNAQFKALEVLDTATTNQGNVLVTQISEDQNRQLDTTYNNNKGNADSNGNEIDDDENPFLVYNDDDESSGFGKIDDKVRNFYGK